ncbi:type II secretion system F family protein [Aeromicrobium sp. CTD01-1L150]|uniref:type II secretion system F family protein n=1 Tax=Aeromicrobium sp. CTD01-1L150 TaxID=3341830 RepID=UPI0035BF7CA6
MNIWTVLTSAAVAAAVLLRWPPRGWVVRHRLGPDPRTSGGRGPGWAPRRWPMMAAMALASAVVLLADALAPAIAGATVVAVGWFVIHQLRVQRARAARDATRTQVCAALDLLAAELRGGVLPSRALAAAAESTESLRPVAPVVTAGGDVPEALRRVAARPGAGAWAALASGWAVAERVGAPLADVVERMADTVRADLELAREVGSEAAPARATGRLMAALPVLGLGLGAGLGADPIHLLTRTVPGALCLAVGAALACLGTWWVDRVVDAAESQA